MKLFPPHIRCVTVVAPAGPLAAEAVEDGCAFLREQGITVKVTPAAAQPAPGYLAASARQRADELTAAWLDPETDAIFAIRGGFGSAHLLPLLPWEKLAARPDLPVIGYSDITALHWAMTSLGIGTPIIGPMIGKIREAALNPFTALSLRRALVGEPATLDAAPEYGPLNILNPGTAAGLPLAGNLTVAASLAGTPWMPDPTGKIILLEDLNEPPYRIDRYFTQLEQSGFLHRAAGLILGQFSDCGDLTPILTRLSSTFPGPILTNYPFGHTFPLASINFRPPLSLSLTN